jgi:uncharacterized membrane-anchored protein YhcB (DUF1043 family)
MDTMWVVAIAAVIVAAVAGFLIGRSTGGSKERIVELETEVSRHKEEIAEYKKEVETHFDETATLFVDMAGSYKALFEHLSADYEKLSEGSARELFKERVSAMLLEDGASVERKAIAASAGPSADASKPAGAGPESDAVKGDAEPVATEKADQQTAEEKADGQVAAATEAEKKPGTDEGASAPESGADEQKAAQAEGDTPADAAEKPAKPQAEGGGKAAEPARSDAPEETKPRAEDKPATEDSESTLERAAKKRAESAATEGGAESKGS